MECTCFNAKLIAGSIFKRCELGKRTPKNSDFERLATEHLLVAKHKDRKSNTNNTHKRKNIFKIYILCKIPKLYYSDLINKKFKAYLKTKLITQKIRKFIFINVTP